MQKIVPASKAIEIQPRRLEYAHSGGPRAWQNPGMWGAPTTYAHLYIWLAAPHSCSLCCSQKAGARQLGKAVPS